MTGSDAGEATVTQLGWTGIARIGVVQAALGSLVVLMTSTLNRVMVVELALPASLPAALVGWHYAVQLSRPKFGHGADRAGSRTPWIVGGVATLGVGATAAAVATELMQRSPLLGIALAVLAFFVIGLGVGAGGTNLLALLACRTPAARKAAAAAIVWIMMISGFILTTVVVGRLIEPFSFDRLIQVVAGVGCVATLASALALRGLDPREASPLEAAADGARSAKPPFAVALREVWSEPRTRRFTIFVAVSMLGYSMQDLILEPFAGLVYDYSPGRSTALSGVQNGGVLLGMITTAVVGTMVGRSRALFMRRLCVGGCVGSAVALVGLVAGALAAPAWPLAPTVFALGLANGIFAVSAIGSMMTLASDGEPGREGTRMGVWGAAQAIAFGVGGAVGAVAVDGVGLVLEAPASAFAVVFALEASVFLVASRLAAGIELVDVEAVRLPAMPAPFELAIDGPATPVASGAAVSAAPIARG
ncbi:MAG: BCD family MFS transporter [Myxococcota bacterium]